MLHYFFMLALAVAISTSCSRLFAEAPPRFGVEVMAVLSKGGCNAGGCHGNLNGKGGFRLSLRGADANFDFQHITHELQGRRIDRFAPEQSLLLQKPLGIVPHQGGVRFNEQSAEYAILRDWIAAGGVRGEHSAAELVKLKVTPTDVYLDEPRDSVQLQVEAQFRDGSSHNITNLACYDLTNLNATVSPGGLVTRARYGETTVLVRFLQSQVPVHIAFVPQREHFVWSQPAEHNFIDKHVHAKLKRLKMNPSPRCDDSTFLRRATLDCLGMLPTAEEAKAFVSDTSQDKREAFIEALVKRKEFADFWALKFSDILRNEEKVLDKRGVELFYQWIHKSISQGKPLDRFVRELIVSRGSTYQSAPANFYRANRDPFTRAETTARIFLGVRLQCARCHNHPFDVWTQDDYYQWSAWFGRIDYQILQNDRKDKLDLNSFNGEQIIHILSEGEVTNPRSNSAAPPHFLGAATPEIPDNADRTVILAEWLASPRNKMFVRSQVNWVWYQLLGRGLIEPLDDARATNPPSHPALLDELAKEFVSQKCDLRSLVKTILRSAAYQVASEPNETNREDEANYAHANIRRLSAEQLLDAQSDLIGVRPSFGGYPAGTRAIHVRGVVRTTKEPGDRFLKLFGKPDRLLACECERSHETTLNQTLLSISAADLQERLEKPGNRLDGWLKAGLSPEAVVDEVYWTALSRPPNEAERAAGVAFLAASPDRFATLQDYVWAIMNAKEFILRR